MTNDSLQGRAEPVCTCLSISRDPLCVYHGDVDKVVEPFRIGDNQVQALSLQARAETLLRCVNVGTGEKEVIRDLLTELSALTVQVQALQHERAQYRTEQAAPLRDAIESLRALVKSECGRIAYLDDELDTVERAATQAITAELTAREKAEAQVQALQQELEVTKQRLAQWRGWAQFVYLGGGPVVLEDDRALQGAVCATQDEQIVAERSAREKAEAQVQALTQQQLVEQQRRACSCAQPDPVMQADNKFYCHKCSFETGARPRNLEPENWLADLIALRAERDAITARVQALTQERDEWKARHDIEEEDATQWRREEAIEKARAEHAEAEAAALRTALERLVEQWREQVKVHQTALDRTDINDKEWWAKMLAIGGTFKMCANALDAALTSASAVQSKEP